MESAPLFSFAERLRTWYEYEKDCNRKVMEMLRSVPEERRGDPSFARALTKMGHLVSARHNWLIWLKVREGAQAERFPRVTLEELAASIGAVEKLWTEYLATLTDADLARTLEWTRRDGKHVTQRLIEILTQVFGHGWYHRGQIAMLVNDLGGRAVDTDYIYWEGSMTVS